MPEKRMRRLFHLNTCISIMKWMCSPRASRARRFAHRAPESQRGRVGTQPGHGLGRSLRTLRCALLGKVEDVMFPAGNRW